ncbi:Pkinase-domain-containing protein [Gonapodya prolifera JEL478]|uniref:Pkinase-domain-containing protein n=1 Tax=Gonapodya prolifera (strain JEL478) TaxID=1344416 RepID=A0A139AZN8_GONPJ|nr:Pkinase-domain-containing protein [Gonapodya prolifera JEL478]|eukprot:KXS22189.1 Pkinase-domain-containing protein [Gonapodya prolifera JEL478]
MLNSKVAPLHTTHPHEMAKTVHGPAGHSTAHVPPQPGPHHLPGPTQPVLAPCEYKTGKTLGQGSYATVKEAVHVKSGKRYAVKVISKQLMKGKEVMILNEIEVLKRVSKGHPNIVTLWDYFETPNNLYLVMDLCVGGELFDRICEKGSYYEEDAAAIARVVVDAVRYLHEQNVVHRDIKAENLLFRTRESSDPADLLIADFGLSKIIDDSHYHLLMTTCGTPGYMAPEVIRRVGHHKPVDMWSIGVLTYFLLCGYTPFDANSQAEEIQNILKGKYAFEPKEYWEDVSEDAKDFIRRLLVINPKDRLTAVDAMKHPFLNPHPPDTPLAMSPVSPTFPTSLPSALAAVAAAVPLALPQSPDMPSAMESIVAAAAARAAPQTIPVSAFGTPTAAIPLPTTVPPPSSITPVTPSGAPTPIPIPIAPVQIPQAMLAASAPPDVILRQMAAMQAGTASGGGLPSPIAIPNFGAASYTDVSALAAYYGGTAPAGAAFFGTSLQSARERVNLLPSVRKNITARQRLKRAVVTVEAANKFSHNVSSGRVSPAGATSSVNSTAGATLAPRNPSGASEGEGSSPMLVATRRPIEVPSLSSLSLGLNGSHSGSASRSGSGSSMSTPNDNGNT